MAENTAIQKTPTAQFRDFLVKNKDSLAEVMPQFLTPDRVIKIAIAAFDKTPKLQQCSMTSIYKALHASVQMGLEAGTPIGHAYFVPFGKECTLVVGYQGLLELARRSGTIDSISAEIVWSNDHFERRMGSERTLVHIPPRTGDRGVIEGVYAIAFLKGGGTQYEYMPISEVNALRDRSPAGRSGPWVTDYGQMVRKTAIRRLCKYLPLSIEMALAVEHEEKDEIEVPKVTERAVPNRAPLLVPPVEELPQDAGGGHDPATGEVEVPLTPPNVDAARTAQSVALIIDGFRQAKDRESYDAVCGQVESAEPHLSKPQLDQIAAEQAKAAKRLGGR